MGVELTSRRPSQAKPSHLTLALLADETDSFCRDGRYSQVCPEGGLLPAKQPVQPNKLRSECFFSQSNTTTSPVCLSNRPGLLHTSYAIRPLLTQQGGESNQPSSTSSKPGHSLGTPPTAHYRTPNAGCWSLLDADSKTGGPLKDRLTRRSCLHELRRSAARLQLSRDPCLNPIDSTAVEDKPTLTGSDRVPWS